MTSKMLHISRNLVGGIIFTILLLYAGIHMFYYEHTVSPELLAEKLIAKNRPAKDCFLFRTFDIGPRPTTYEMQMRCVRRYAKLTKDPSACELLLPGDYGWSCLGNISGELFSGRLCTRSGALDRISVYCNRNSEGEIKIDNPQINNCSLYKRKDLREWCHSVRTELISNIHECDKVSHDAIRDYCEYGYSLKMKNPELCNFIVNKERRGFCRKYVELSVQYR